MSNSLDPDQAQYCVGPDLDPNCLQRLSAYDNLWLAGREFKKGIDISFSVLLGLLLVLAANIFAAQGMFL